MRKKSHPKRQKSPITWLPIDSRLLPPLFSFGHVKGLARWFIILEIIMATLVVIGACALALIKVVKAVNPLP